MNILKIILYTWCVVKNLTYIECCSFDSFKSKKINVNYLIQFHFVPVLLSEKQFFWFKSKIVFKAKLSC